MVDFEEGFRDRMIFEAARDPAITRIAFLALGDLADAAPGDSFDVTENFASLAVSQLARYGLTDRDHIDQVFVSVFSDMAQDVEHE